MVELGRLLVVKNEQEFVNKEEHYVKYEGKRVHDWHTRREHKNAPEISVVLGVNVVSSYLVSCVERLKLILEHLLGVDTIVAALKGFFVLERSIFISEEKFDERSYQVGDVW